MKIMPNVNNSENFFSQNDFMNAIIHELKTPLNAIIGFSEILKLEIRDSQSTEVCADYAQEINQAAVDLNDLVHDLLDVNSSGSFSVDLSKEIDVRDLIKRSVRLNHDYALRGAISIKVEIAENVTLIKLDMKRMKQILINLISNAIKYSPRQSNIKIIAKNIFEDNEIYLQITISDQGFGHCQIKIDN